MRTLIFGLLFLSLQVNAQKKLSGVFGQCDENSYAYFCQQILFRSDSTFELYDKLHLRDWVVTKGTWERNGDTVILNTRPGPFTIVYSGDKNTDSVKIKFSGDARLSLLVNQAGKNYSIYQSSFLAFPKNMLDSIRVFNNYTFNNFKIIFEKNILNHTDSIEINFNNNFGYQVYFEKTRWLLEKSKIYHTQLPDGQFDKKRFFRRVPIFDLRYKKPAQN